MVTTNHTQLNIVTTHRSIIMIEFSCYETIARWLAVFLFELVMCYRLPFDNASQRQLLDQAAAV